jgi:hypothetical protein
LGAACCRLDVALRRRPDDEQQVADSDALVALIALIASAVAPAALIAPSLRFE